MLRTIIEKASSFGKPQDRDIALLFIDLSKAYDCVSHELLWAKLLKLGLSPTFVNVLKALYKDSTVRIMVNGHLSNEVHYERGIKQGCVLSPLLFIMFVSDLGKILESHPGGILINGKVISGVMYVDDLILIGKNQQAIEEILLYVQYNLEGMDMAINCSKNNIMALKETPNDTGLTLKSSKGKILGEMNRVKKYKYLGVRVSVGNAASIFQTPRKEMISRLKSFASLILPMAKDSFDPVVVGTNLWKSIALPSVLYGIEIISVTQSIINEMDSIQGRFCASLIGVRITASHTAIRRELGLPSIESMIYKRKLLYWNRLRNLEDELG